MYFVEADEIACWAANVYTQTALEKLIRALDVQRALMTLKLLHFASISGILQLTLVYIIAWHWAVVIQ